MVGGIHTGVYLYDFAVWVDHKGVAGRKFHHAKICERAVSPSHFVICVRKQLEVETLFRAELFVGIDVVAADSEDDSVTLGVFRLIHLKLVGFTGSTGGLVFWIEIEDDPFATVVFEADGTSILRREREVGSFTAD